MRVQMVRFGDGTYGMLVTRDADNYYVCDLPSTREQCREDEQSDESYSETVLSVEDGRIVSSAEGNLSYEVITQREAPTYVVRAFKRERDQAITNDWQSSGGA